MYEDASLAKNKAAEAISSGIPHRSIGIPGTRVTPGGGSGWSFEVGMARAYGYGATMGAWCTDFLANWAGHEGMVRHTKADFRGPAFEGDVTYFDAEVVDKITESGWGVPLVQIKLRLTSQDGTTLVSCTAEIELPR